MKGTDFLHLDLIIRMIGHLHRRLSRLSANSFATDIDEVDLTAFRFAVIGEATTRLSGAVKERHANIPWSLIYGLRNIIVHDYDAVVPDRLWAVYANDLGALEAVCKTELGQFQ
jgi:uncharacterized protein with HEPN domain